MTRESRTVFEVSAGQSWTLSGQFADSVRENESNINALRRVS